MVDIKEIIKSFIIRTVREDIVANGQIRQVTKGGRMVDIESKEFKEAVLKVVNTALRDNTSIRSVMKKCA